MDKRKIISISTALFIFLLALFIIPSLKKEKEERIEKISLLIHEAEDSIKSKGVLKLADINYPKLKNLTVFIYYKEDYCLAKIKDTIKKFDNAKIERVTKVNKKKKLPNIIKPIEDNIELPIIILKGDDKQAQRIINGVVACSDKILTYILCDSIENPPEFCYAYTITKIKTQDNVLKSAEDRECYKKCFVEYNKNEDIINQLWQGPICGRIDTYTEGVTNIINKRCLEKSCKNNTEDRACCNKDKCVYKEECYNLGDINDVDNNGKREICMIHKNNPLWIDPDKDNISCSFANYRWFDCKQKTECINGINSHSNKENGLCCGDDNNEFFTECNGGICGKEDHACCKLNQCVYKNRCYPAGCANIKTDTGTKKMYCDGIKNEWVELDEQYCEKCLGKNSWTGSICCGDDENEGHYYKEWILYNKTSKMTTGKFYCTNSNQQCISPINNKTINEGCFNIPKIENMEGVYYCKKGEWYDPDYSKEYCYRCGLNWVSSEQEDKCCGDDKEEYFIRGEDNTAACCNSGSSYVVQGKCHYYQNCGNSILEGEEECEPINTINSEYCIQTTETCVNGKLGIRDKVGDCNNVCKCDYNRFNYKCIKGKCDAECSNDKDCSEGKTCNINDCRCYKEEKLSQILKDCPYGINLKVNKKRLYINDTFILEIGVYKENNRSMPNVKFWLDIMANNEPVGSSIYSTNQDGVYIIKKLVTKKSNPGVFKYIVKTRYKDCDSIGDSITVEFVIDSVTEKRIETKKLTKKEKSNIIKVWNITKTDFEKPLCGNNKIEIREVCEGNSICRNSLGCEYTAHKYDYVEYCNNCECPNDLWSEPNSEQYCKNCEHCGDGMLNCGELCDNNTIRIGETCKEGMLYERLGICANCIDYKNFTSDILVNRCFCNCPDNPQENCVDGNYISYLEDYFALCSDDKCNECKCKDIYTKDSNNDGIEDKCSDELCGNRIDDNDNGAIDEKECVWYYCSQCGQGLFNLCNKDECRNLKEKCFFEEAMAGYGFCSKCSLLSNCEDYGYNKNNCIENPCNLSSCFWNNFTCCTDSDEDKLCDYMDNCPYTFNPLQEDEDKDGKGAKCEFCDKEPNLFYPQEQNETICNDGINNDCDHSTDCKDKDCLINCINIPKGVFNESK